jgi:hypothetical protein
MRHVALCLPLLLHVWGCAEKAEPKTPEPPADEASPAEKAAENGTLEDTASDAPTSDVATEEDVRAVLQAVLDDEELQQYLGLSLPGRLPFKLAGEGLPSDLQLMKGSDPVQIVDGPKDKEDPVMVITELKIDAKEASVRFRYDVAKLRASANLAKKDYGWELVNSSQSQR